MRDSGKTISNMAKAWKSSQMEPSTKASMSMENPKESDDTPGPMASSMKANGSTE